MTEKQPPPLAIRASVHPKGVLVGDYLIDRPLKDFLTSKPIQKHTRFLATVAMHHELNFPADPADHDDFSPAQYRKDIAAWAASHMGGGFHKQIGAVMYKVWVEPFREWVYQYCMLPGFSQLQRINEKMILSLHQNHDMVSELISRDHTAAIRWCLYFDSTPHTLKRQFGKGLWKRMLACPAYLQARIISLIDRDGDYHFEALVQEGKLPLIIDFMLSCKSSFLERGFKDAWLALRADIHLERYHDLDTLLKRLRWVNDSAATTRPEDTLYAAQVLIADNGVMHHKAGWPFRLQNRKKMEEKHRKVSHYLAQRLAKRLQDDGIAFYEPFPGITDVQDCLESVFANFPHLNASLITSLSMAHDEGKAMSHCLFSHQSYALYGLKIIALSLDNGKQRTTCAFRFTTAPGTKGKQWCTDQHYGFDNAQLKDPDAYRDFSTAVLRALQWAKIQPNGAAPVSLRGFELGAYERDYDDIPF